MRILIVKLSSLGDVVHTLPAVQDLRRAFPGAAIDWVVERGFALLAGRCEGVDRVVPCALRQWRRAPLAATTRAEFRAFRAELQAQAYDAVLDLQGLTKSALVARLARLAPGGRRYALGNQTDGSGWEAPTRWLADVAVPVERRSHAVQRSREMCARAFGYAMPSDLCHGLRARRPAGPEPIVALVHGSSRADKCWAEDHWIELARRLGRQGLSVALVHGSEEEEARSRRIAAALGRQAQVWPRMGLDALVDRLAACRGVVGVDSGLSHVAVALGLAHVQIYNFDTAWRTGPIGSARQRSVYAPPSPAVDLVWNTWLQVEAA